MPTTASTEGSGGNNAAKSYDENVPYTPAWAEQITGVPADQIVTVAREFADNAEKTNGRSMVILGGRSEPLVSHGHELPGGSSTFWVMCGCVGQSGGGWAHYVGQENCARKPDGCRWPLGWIGAARPGT